MKQSTEKPNTRTARHRQRSAIADTKRQIILEMYKAELVGERARGKELAFLLDRAPNTISTEIKQLSMEIPAPVEMLQRRGHWQLTEEGRRRARELLPGIPFLGTIAAGPAKQVDNISNKFIPIEYDPENLFALDVVGDSMVSYGINPGDTLIMEYVNAHSLNLQDGDILAILVPAGTDVTSEDELKKALAKTEVEVDYYDILDHATLKIITTDNLLEFRKSIQMKQTLFAATGVYGTVRAGAFLIQGRAIEIRRPLGKRSKTKGRALLQ